VADFVLAEVEKNVRADTAEEYLVAAHKAMRSNKSLGNTTCEVEYSGTLKNKILSNVKVKLSVRTTRTVWAGAVTTDPDKNNQYAIDTIVDLIDAHESRHRAAYSAVWDEWKEDFKDKLEGSTEKKAEEQKKSYWH
jgi:hypothetical protein